MQPTDLRNRDLDTLAEPPLHVNQAAEQSLATIRGLAHYNDHEISAERKLRLECLEAEIPRLYRALGLAWESSQAPAPTKIDVFLDLAEERRRQDAKHGGPSHDDTHPLGDWIRMVRDRLDALEAGELYVPRDTGAFIDLTPGGDMMLSRSMAREEIVEAAALLVAALEAIDRVPASEDLVRVRPVHELKVWPEYFDLLAAGTKRHEIRFNDRCYGPGDVLALREYEPGRGYTGREMGAKVSAVLAEGLGVTAGWVALTLTDVSPVRMRSAL